MTTLIRTEWLKMKKYNAFWWIMILTALSYPGINFIFYKVYEDITTRPSTAGDLAKIALGNPYIFPEAWHTVAYFSSWFVFIPAVVVIMLINNEYSFRTHRQNIIDGWSRTQFISSKLIDVLLISFVITLLYAAVAFVTGFSNQADLSADNWSMAYYIGLFSLQTFAQLSIAFLIGFLIRKSFMALGVFLFYYIIFEPIIVGLCKVYVNDIGKFLPLEMSDRMIPVPAFIGRLDQEAYDKSQSMILQHVLLTIIFTALIWLLCYRINNKRDLK